MGKEWEARGLESAGREAGRRRDGLNGGAGAVLGGRGCWVAKHDGAPPWCAAGAGPYSDSGGDRFWGATAWGVWRSEVAANC